MITLTQADRTQTMHDAWHGGENATDQYREFLATLIRPGMSVLHAGCGWDKNNVTRPYKNVCKVVGVDLDPRVTPQFHSEFHLASLSDLPFADNRFDMVVSEYVLEHIENPINVFRELYRVLNSGGRFVVLTPNLYSYKSLTARYTPYRFHLWAGRIRYGAGHEADMYPTHFQCNTIRRFRRLAKASGFRIVSEHLINNGPTWFEKIPIVFQFFHFFHLLIDRSRWAQQLRCALIVELDKAASPHEDLSLEQTRGGLQPGMKRFSCNVPSRGLERQSRLRSYATEFQYPIRNL